jgi:hypothetical protein
MPAFRERKSRSSSASCWCALEAPRARSISTRKWRPASQDGVYLETLPRSEKTAKGEGLNPRTWKAPDRTPAHCTHFLPCAKPEPAPVWAIVSESGVRPNVAKLGGFRMSQRGLGHGRTRASPRAQRQPSVGTAAGIAAGPVGLRGKRW